MLAKWPRGASVRGIAHSGFRLVPGVSGHVTKHPKLHPRRQAKEGWTSVSCTNFALTNRTGKYKSDGGPKIGPLPRRESQPSGASVSWAVSLAPPPAPTDASGNNDRKSLGRSLSLPVPTTIRFHSSLLFRNPPYCDDIDTSKMLRKKEVFTQITVIPSHIPRQLALDILHSHSEIITLNPLVLEHHPVKAPRDAAADEYYATWYEITERIQLVPGIGKMGSGKISFKGCFHDMPWGIQTHIYAPMNIDMRNNWRICGNQPGEPPEPKELGIDAPAEGLYLREDIEIKCNVTMVSFVKNQMKAASKVMVDRIIKKAELLDSGVLQAMMDDGRLRTVNPADRSSLGHTNSFHRSMTSIDPRISYQVPASPGMTPYGPADIGRGGSLGAHMKPAYLQAAPVVMELPGDFQYPPSAHDAGGPRPGYSPPQQYYEPGGLRPSYSVSSQHRESAASSNFSSPDPNSGSRWSAFDSASSRPTSGTSETSNSLMRSPAPDQKGFATELPTHTETREEHEPVANQATLSKLEGRPVGKEAGYQYRPHGAGFTQ